MFISVHSTAPTPVSICERFWASCHRKLHALTELAMDKASGKRRDVFILPEFCFDLFPSAILRFQIPTTDDDELAARKLGRKPTSAQPGSGGP
jgi:hypothetical protein